MPAKLHLEAKRRYFPIEEVAAKAGISVEEIIHGAAHGDFPVYTLANNWDIRAFIWDPDDGTWGMASPNRLNQYSGPIRLYPEDLMRYEADPSAAISKLMGDAAGYIEYGPDEEWEFRLAGDPIPLRGCVLVMMEGDLGLGDKSTGKTKKQAKPTSQEVLSLVGVLPAPEGKQEQAQVNPKMQVADLASMPGDAYLRQADLIKKIVPFSSATLWRKVNKGEFPAPVKLSERITAWRVDDIRRWLENHRQS